MTWDRISSSYDRVAEVYETRFADELDAKPADRALLADFAGATPGPIVDIGCGPGHIGSFVRAPDRRVIGLDVSAAMARRAATRLDAAVVADVRALPFADGRLGGIVAFYSLIHLRRHELGGALAEFRRVLRPGGAALVSAHEGAGEVAVEDFLGAQVPVAATLFDLDELVGAMQAAGLEVVAARRRAPYANEGTTTRLYVHGRRTGS